MRVLLQSLLQVIGGFTFRSLLGLEFTQPMRLDMHRHELKRTCLRQFHTLAMCGQEGLRRNAVTARRRRVFVNPSSGSAKPLLFFTDATCGTSDRFGACTQQRMDVSEAVAQT